MKARYRDIENQLSDPRVYANQFQCRTLTRERGRLSEFFRLHKEWADSLRESTENHELLQSEQDEALRQMIESEIALLSVKVEAAEKAVTRMLLPPDPNDGRNIIVELRPAAGGEEAALFTALMLRVYTKYAERRGWKFELLDLSESGLGGVKEAIFSLTGDEIFSPHEIRKRRSPRPAGSRDRSLRTDSHLHDHGFRPAGSRGNG